MEKLGASVAPKINVSDSIRFHAASPRLQIKTRCDVSEPLRHLGAHGAAPTQRRGPPASGSLEHTCRHHGDRRTLKTAFPPPRGDPEAPRRRPGFPAAHPTGGRRVLADSQAAFVARSFHSPAPVRDARHTITQELNSSRGEGTACERDERPPGQRTPLTPRLRPASRGRARGDSPGRRRRRRRCRGSHAPHRTGTRRPRRQENLTKRDRVRLPAGRPVATWTGVTPCHRGPQRARTRPECCPSPCRRGSEAQGAGDCQGRGHSPCRLAPPRAPAVPVDTSAARGPRAAGTDPPRRLARQARLPDALRDVRPGPPRGWAALPTRGSARRCLPCAPASKCP